MKTVMGLTNHPNFKQTIIMIDNQIVYTIAKKLQWCYSGKCKRMFMLRPLRIEMVFINLIGGYISYWTDIFNKANISTVEGVESFLVGNNVK